MGPGTLSIAIGTSSGITDVETSGRVGPLGIVSVTYVIVLYAVLPPQEMLVVGCMVVIGKGLPTA